MLATIQLMGVERDMVSSRWGSRSVKLEGGGVSVSHAGALGRGEGGYLWLLEERGGKWVRWLKGNGRMGGRERNVLPAAYLSDTSSSTKLKFRLQHVTVETPHGHLRELV